MPLAPVVMPHSRALTKSARGTPLFLHMIGMLSTAPTSNMNLLVPLTHSRGSLPHGLPPSSLRGDVYHVISAHDYGI